MSGPGKRYTIWVQGCSRHCDGCMAPDTWPHDGGTLMPIDELKADILSVRDIEGITFLGGEPFEQAAAVAELAGVVRKHGLSVVVFTGYTLVELRRSTDDGVAALISVADLLIDGHFDRTVFDLSRAWVGSANQNYHYLTGRYTPEDVVAVTNQIEVRISPDGRTLINGMGDFEKIKCLLH